MTQILEADDDGLMLDEMATFEAELNGLIASSMKAKAERDEITKLRGKMNLPGLSKSEAQEIREKVLEWEARNEWEVVGVGYYYLVQICNECKGENAVRVGYISQQRHKVNRTTTRFVKSANRPDAFREGSGVNLVNCKTVEHVEGCHVCDGFASSTALTISEI